MNSGRQLSIPSGTKPASGPKSSFTLFRASLGAQDLKEQNIQVQDVKRQDVKDQDVKMHGSKQEEAKKGLERENILKFVFTQASYEVELFENAVKRFVGYSKQNNDVFIELSVIANAMLKEAQYRLEVLCDNQVRYDDRVIMGVIHHLEIGELILFFQQKIRQTRDELLSQEDLLNHETFLNEFLMQNSLVNIVSEYEEYLQRYEYLKYKENPADELYEPIDKAITLWGEGCYRLLFQEKIPSLALATVNVEEDIKRLSF